MRNPESEERADAVLEFKAFIIFLGIVAIVFSVPWVAKAVAMALLPYLSS